MPANNDRPRDRNVPPRNVVRDSRSSNRPKAFSWILGLIVLVGIAALGYVASKPKSRPAQSVRDIADTTNAGPPQGYLIGKVDAPVKISEYADFECPSCGGWATVTEPDVRSRIINAGLANLTYYDFPLNQHRNTLAASNAAACADEQGKFWPMHTQLFDHQSEWSALRDASGRFRGYAQQVGLDVGKYDGGMKSAKFAGRIQASLDEGTRLGVTGTPTFLIGGRLYANAASTSDSIRAIVLSLLPKPKP